MTQLLQTYRMTIAYDGTDFQGWQHQPHHLTISDCLEKTYERIFQEPISIIGASRTDSGVHALGQVAQFRTASPWSEDAMLRAWNQGLPNSIVIRNIVKTNDSFHPCFDVLQKTYFYTLFLQKPLPFFARFGWHYHFIDRVDLEKFYAGLQLYLGEHDFASFCKQGQEKSTIRSIDSITMKKISRWGALLITIKGKSFLHFQIRRMIGYALDVARRPELPVNYLKSILDNPNPQQTLLKADGSGLCLRKVVYKHDISGF